MLGKSLLRQEHLAGEPRLTMLETVREYGLERLEASGEASTVRARHAEYCLGLAEDAEPNLLGPDQAAWLARLDREHDNIRAALTWSRTAESGPGLVPAEVGLRLAGALQWFWYIRCHLTEGRRSLEPMLASDAAVPAGVRAGGLVTLGRLMQAQGDYVVSATPFEEGAALYRQVEDRRSAAFAIGARGQNAMAQADYPLAIARFEESLALYRAEDDRWGIGWTLGNLGRTAQARGEHEQAVALLDESLRFKREVGDPIALGLGLGFRGRAAYAMRDYPQATALFEESLRLFREVGHPRGIGTALYDLGRVARATGSHERAAILQAQSLQIQREEGYRLGIAECLEGLAGLCAEQALAPPLVEATSRAHLELAARLFGASEALREVIAAPMQPVDRAGYESAVALVRTHLGSGLARCWGAGRAAPLEQSIEEALAFAEHPPPRAASPESPAAASTITLLSTRERDVVHLIARGYTSPQIGTELMITRRTVESHVTTILNKLGLSSRTQVALWAVEHGLSATRPASPDRVVDLVAAPGTTMARRMRAPPELISSISHQANRCSSSTTRRHSIQTTTTQTTSNATTRPVSPILSAASTIVVVTNPTMSGNWRSGLS